MPSHDRLWLNEHQRRAPIPPDSGQHDPEQSVARPDTHTRGRPCHRPELLPQRHVLQDHFVMAPAGQHNGAANQHNQLQHASIVSVSRAKSIGTKTDGVLANDRMSLQADSADGSAATVRMPSRIACRMASTGANINDF
jgi:hypothetical protein